MYRIRPIFVLLSVVVLALALAASDEQPKDEKKYAPKRLAANKMPTAKMFSKSLC